ncbi:MAG: porin [Moorea sp. SIO2B7]|nr:porin [Moorena sp. SIO2B7]
MSKSIADVTRFVFSNSPLFIKSVATVAVPVLLVAERVGVDSVQAQVSNNLSSNTNQVSAQEQTHNSVLLNRYQEPRQSCRQNNIVGANPHNQYKSSCDDPISKNNPDNGQSLSSVRGTGSAQAPVNPINSFGLKPFITKVTNSSQPMLPIPSSQPIAQRVEQSQQKLTDSNNLGYGKPARPIIPSLFPNPSQTVTTNRKTVTFPQQYPSVSNGNNLPVSSVNPGASVNPLSATAATTQKEDSSILLAPKPNIVSGCSTMVTPCYNPIQQSGSRVLTPMPPVPTVVRTTLPPPPSVTTSYIPFKGNSRVSYPSVKPPDASYLPRSVSSQRTALKPSAAMTGFYGNPGNSLSNRGQESTEVGNLWLPKQENQALCSVGNSCEPPIKLAAHFLLPDSLALALNLSSEPYLTASSLTTAQSPNTGIFEEETLQQSLVLKPQGQKKPVTQPQLRFQGAYVLQGDNSSSRARVTGFYPILPNLLLGGSLDLTDGIAFADSRTEGLQVNELYIAGSLPEVPNLRFVLGQLDLTSYFDRNSFAKDGVSHFFNPLFQTNPALAATGISSRQGILANWAATDYLELKVAGFSSARAVENFNLDAFAGEIGVRYGNAILRGSYSTNRDAGLNDGFQEIFSIPRDNDITGIDEDDREESYGINAEVFIPNLKMGLFARYGYYRNNDLDEGGVTYSGGLTFLDLFTPSDRLGLAYGRGLSNERLRKEAGNPIPDVFEVYYDLRLLPSLRLGFTVQAFDNFSEAILGFRVKSEFDLVPIFK